MTDRDILYPGDYDVLPVTTTVTPDIANTLNTLRESILNMQEIIGLDVNIGLFTPTPDDATVTDRLNRIEKGIADRNLVFRELNVSDALQVLLDQNNKPFVNLGLGTPTETAPVTILGPLSILSPTVANPETIIQTPIKLDVTPVSSDKSSNSLIKGRSNNIEPLLTISDTNTNPEDDELAFVIEGNVSITGKLFAEFSIDHSKLLNTDTVPSGSTRGEVKHVTQGDFHTHRKGTYNSDTGTWTVASNVETDDRGIISHRDLVDITTLPTQGADFTPDPDLAYHVTGGDLHSHKDGDGAQIDHNDLKNISPNFSNHVTGGDTHAHTSSGDGGTIAHSDLSNINTTGDNAIHVTGGDGHNHGVDDDGNPIGNGAQIDHNHLLNISPASSNHVTGGDSHAHTSDGDGGVIDHTNLSNVGNLTHDEIEDRIDTFRATTTGTAVFTASEYEEITVLHSLGTDQFNVAWSLSGVNFAPPSSPSDVGTIYVTDKTSSNFKFKRIGGSIPGPASKATLLIPFSGSNNDLLFQARQSGSDGNDISISFTTDLSLSAGGIDIISSSVDSSIDVRINSNGSNPTAQEAKTVIESDAVANNLVSVFFDTSLDSGNDGSGAVDAYAATNLEDGEDTTGFSQMELEWIIVSKT